MLEKNLGSLDWFYEKTLFYMVCTLREPDPYQEKLDELEQASVDPWSIVTIIRECKGILEVREMVRSAESLGVTYSKLERIVRHWKRKIDTGKIKMKWVESGR